MAEVNAVNVNQPVNALGSSAETANQKTYSEEDIKLFDIDKDGKLNVAERAAVDAYHNNEGKIKFDFDKDGELDRAEKAAYDAYTTVYEIEEFKQQLEQIPETVEIETELYSENQADDRGFWENAGVVLEGIEMTPIRETLTKGVTVADMVAGSSIGCVEVAVPTMAGARGYTKISEDSTKINNSNYNDDIKKTGYEDLGEGLACLDASIALGVFGDTSLQTKCMHGKHHHSHHHTPHQPTHDETFINDPSQFKITE